MLKNSENTWQKALSDIKPLSHLDCLPRFAFQLFFKEPGPFLPLFWLLTLCSAAAAAARFSVIYLLSQLITELGKHQLTFDAFIWWYLPLWAGLLITAEALDFFTRRYGETLPPVYRDYITLRFLLGILEVNSYRLFNVSKERLSTLLNRYVQNAQSFIADWIWDTSARAVRLVIVIGILAVQSPWILSFNLLYIAGFCWLAFKLSRRMANYAANYSKAEINQAALTSSYLINLTSIKRQRLNAFVAGSSSAAVSRCWSELNTLQTFHSKRWLLQFNLFNLMYVGTLAYGVVQVLDSELPLGFLLLIKWAYDELWHILVYFIEYYANIIQQDKENEIVRREFAALARENFAVELYEPSDWKALSVSNLTVTFTGAENTDSPRSIKIGSLSVERGSKIGIIGPSGSGKSTIFNALLNLVPYTGSISIDNQDLGKKRLSTRFLTIIGNNEPLLPLTLRDNLALGRPIDERELERIIKGVCAEEFLNNLEARVGSPEFNLSSGQEQRLRLARGLLNRSEIYLLDEPFNGIDHQTKERILDFIREHLTAATIILVTHEKGELELVDKTYELRAGHGLSELPG